MGAFRNITTGVLASALLATSVTPAMADGPRGGFGGGFGGGYGHREHHDHDGIGAGAIIAGILGIGIIAAVASSASSDKHRDQYPREGYPNGYPNNPPPPVSNYPYPQQQRNGAVASENDAVDACAVAAEEQAGRSASVRDIKQVKSNDNGWDVKGVIEERESYRSQRAELHNFKCTVRYGAVQSVRIDDELAYNF